MADQSLTRNQQKEQTRSNILQAALEEFSLRGYDGTNVRAIAEKAGVNHGLIKYYFEGKENLWKEAVGFMFQRHAEEVVYVESDDLEESIREYIRSYTRYCARHPEHTRIMLQASMHGRERLEWAIEHFLMPNKEALVSAIEMEKGLGILPNVPTVSLIYTIVSSCQLVFALAAEVDILYGVDVNNSDFIENHADSIADLVIQKRR